MPDYELFTALRYDPKLLSEDFNTRVNGSPSPYIFLPYHHERLVKAAAIFQWPKATELITASSAAELLRKKCDDAVAAHPSEEKHKNGLRLRVLLSSDGNLSVQTFDTPPLTSGPLDAAYFNPDTMNESNAPLPIFKVYLDSQETPSSLFTSYKTTAREHYEAARARRGIVDRKDKKEVVLYNEKGELTEASYRNAAFWRDGMWVSPAAASGGLPGTVRRWLLEQGLMKEAVIHKDDVYDGQWVLLTNGVDISVLGRLVL